MDRHINSLSTMASPQGVGAEGMAFTHFSLAHYGYENCTKITGINVLLRGVSIDGTYESSTFLFI